MLGAGITFSTLLEKEKQIRGKGRRCLTENNVTDGGGKKGVRSISLALIQELDLGRFLKGLVVCLGMG